MKWTFAIGVSSLCLFAAGCGFQPLYATAAEDSVVSLSNVRLVGVTGRGALVQSINDAFHDRAFSAGGEAQYDLGVMVEESARPLAVQIDATVSRFSYEIRGLYSITETLTGKRVSGAVTSVASFNVVTSNYSTLVAEQAARDKAARQLITLIERDALLKLSRTRKAADEAIEDDPIIADDTLVDIYTGADPRDPGAELLDETDADAIWNDIVRPAPEPEPEAQPAPIEIDDIQTPEG